MRIQIAKDYFWTIDLRRFRVYRKINETDTGVRTYSLNPKKLYTQWFENKATQWCMERFNQTESKCKKDSCCCHPWITSNK